MRHGDRATLLTMTNEANSTLTRTRATRSAQSFVHSAGEVVRANEPVTGEEVNHMSNSSDTAKPNEDAAITAFRSRPNCRPEEIANVLGVSGKLVRGYLRMTFPRNPEAKGTTWVLTNDQLIATLDHFIARRSPVSPTPTA